MNMLQKNPPVVKRLQKRADFLRVKNKGDSVATPSVVVQFAKRKKAQKQKRKNQAQPAKLHNSNTVMQNTATDSNALHTEKRDTLKLGNVNRNMKTQDSQSKQQSNNGDLNNDVADNTVYIGFTATKKIGKANVRNRAKRRLRAAIAEKYPQLCSGYDIVLIARAATPNRTWAKLQKDLDDALQKAGVLCTQVKV